MPCWQTKSVLNFFLQVVFLFPSLNLLGCILHSGGGFSTYFPTPDYQKDTVVRYFDGLSAEQSPSSGYNRRGRAYPDVALLGVWYETVIQGYFTPMFGTSASAPVFGAMVSMLNAARAAQNKSSLGFLNPTLYAHGANASGLFNDITSGHSKCMSYTGDNPSEAVCCKSGFYATPSWDPLTGWGSINFDNLGAMFDTPAPYTYPKNNGRDLSLNIDLSTLVLIIIVGATLVGAVLGGIVYAICFAKKRAPQSGDVAMVEVSLHPAPLGTPLNNPTSADAEGVSVSGFTAPRSGFFTSLTRSQPGNYAPVAVHNPLAPVSGTYAQPP